MIIIVKFERYVTSICIFFIIICKFYHRQKLCPVILFSVNKNPKISLYSAIFLLTLAISLRVKSSRQLLLDAKKII